MQNECKTKRCIWIDTDSGTDDAHAIFIALSQPEVEIVGISTVYGNTTAKQSAVNVIRILKLADRLDIPVYVGVEKSLTGTPGGGSGNFHGKDGLGEVPDDDDNTQLIKTDNAVLAMLRAIKQKKGCLEILALGPLTNLAIALRLDAVIATSIQHCYIMGGNYRAEGNITAAAEYNFYCDPEAAHVILSEFQCPVTLICWESCIKVPWAFYDEMVSQGTKKSSFIGKINQFCIDKYYGNTELYPDKNTTSHETADQVAAAVAAYPDIVKSCVRHQVRIETSTSALTRGIMIVDWLNCHFKDTKEINLVLDIDNEQFLQLMKDSLK